MNSVIAAMIAATWIAAMRTSSYNCSVIQ
jgi:hypothetical protein